MLSRYLTVLLTANNSRIEFYNEKMNNDFYFEHDKRNDNLSFIIQMKKYCTSTIHSNIEK